MHRTLEVLPLSQYCSLLADNQARRQGLRKLANPGSRKFKYGPSSFKLGSGETDTLMYKAQAKAQQGHELRHPGE
jgi:hypothetical protein